GHHHKGFFPRASLGGVARQPVEHRRAGFARQSQFGWRRRFRFAYARHPAIDGIAVQNRAALAGDGPGYIGFGGSLRDSQGILGGAAAPRPNREKKEKGEKRNAQQERVTGKTCNLRRGYGQPGGTQGQKDEGQSSPAPRSDRHAQAAG